MDKQTFASIQATTNTSRFAAAVFRKGEALAGLCHLLGIYGWTLVAHPWPPNDRLIFG